MRKNNSRFLERPCSKCLKLLSPFFYLYRGPWKLPARLVLYRKEKNRDFADPVLSSAATSRPIFFPCVLIGSFIFQQKLADLPGGVMTEVNRAWRVLELTVARVPLRMIASPT